MTHFYKDHQKIFHLMLHFDLIFKKLNSIILLFLYISFRNVFHKGFKQKRTKRKNQSKSLVFCKHFSLGQTSVCQSNVPKRIAKAMWSFVTIVCIISGLCVVLKKFEYAEILSFHCDEND